MDIMPETKLRGKKESRQWFRQLVPVPSGGFYEAA